MRFTMLPFLPMSMRHVPRSLVLAIGVAVSLGACQAAPAPGAQDDHAAAATEAATQSAAAPADAHAGHAGETVAVTALPDGQRWETDAPLRAGMRNLREATETLNHYEMGHLDDVQRDNAVAKIDAAIKDMIANCKLKPEADAALHGLLTKFIAGANAARAGKFGKAELAPMQEALAQYPQLFDDHDWSETAN